MNQEELPFDEEARTAEMLELHSRFEEVKRLGFAGMSRTTGFLCDRREEPDAIPLAENSYMGIPKPQPVPAPIYIDALLPCLPNKNWRWEESCHLFADPGDHNLQALHAFAKKIGLRRSWFQNHGTLPHYDLNSARRMAAVKAGAIELDRRGTVERIRAWRAAKTA